MNANVISKPLKQNSKTPDVSTLLGFFFISNLDEQFSNNADKQMLNQQVNENVTRLN